MYRLAAVLLSPLLVTAALAQESPPAAPPQTVQPKEFTLTLSPEEANQLGDALLDSTGSTPRKAMALLQKIREQVTRQVTEAAHAQAEPPK